MCLVSAHDLYSHSCGLEPSPKSHVVLVTYQSVCIVNEIESQTLATCVGCDGTEIETFVAFLLTEIGVSSLNVAECPCLL